MSTFTPAWLPAPIAVAGMLIACHAAAAELLAGVDFEGASQSVFDRNPDDHVPDDGISVSAGGSAPVFDGWTLLRLDGTDGGNGDMRNDNGANAAGATTPNYPVRLEGGRTGSWSIAIDPGVILNLDRIEFDVRGGTNATGRDGQFRTSLDGETTYLWEDFDLPGRTTGNWQRIIIDLSGGLYQNLSDQTVSFIWRTPGGAIDLDTIEVYGTTGSATSSFRLAITPSAETPGGFDFEWDSRPGMLYDLLSSSDLSAAPDSWAVYDDGSSVYGDIASGGVTTTLTGVMGDGPRRFFAVREKEAPPLLQETFEEIAGLPSGWSADDNGAGTAWTVGAPAGVAQEEPDGPATGAQCAGTNIGAKYTDGASASLKTASFTVPPGGATLQLNFYIDTEEASGGDDFGTIRLVDAAGDPIAGGDLAPDLQGTSTNWEEGVFEFPAAANGLEVRIEFLFQSDSDGGNWAGFYIDDVRVTAN